MAKVFKLAYADFASKDVSKLADYYTRTMGYALAHRGEDGSAYMSNGFDHHYIVITPSDYSGVRVYGYQLDRTISLKEVQEQLRKQGVSSVLLTDAKPGIQEFLELSDPDGNVIHLFNEMEQPAIGFGTSGIVPLKLGHIGFHSNNFRKTVDFYTDVLGFTVTDKIGADLCNFLTCNNDHHVLNIVGADRPNKMHHIAFQLKDASHQNISSDILARHGIDVLWGPTRHTSGHNIATYHYDADENLVELFIDLDVYIPELGIFEPRPWHKELPMKPKVWDALSSWGTDFAFDLANLK